MVPFSCPENGRSFGPVFLGVGLVGLGGVGLGWVWFCWVGSDLVWLDCFFDYQTGVITWTLFWVSLLCLPAVYIVFLARMFSNGFLTCVHSHHDVE